VVRALPADTWAGVGQHRDRPGQHLAEPDNTSSIRTTTNRAKCLPRARPARH